jgi:hypothetical protein
MEASREIEIECISNVTLTLPWLSPRPRQTRPTWRESPTTLGN